jgi:hypothetical protein
MFYKKDLSLGYGGHVQSGPDAPVVYYDRATGVMYSPIDLTRLENVQHNANYARDFKQVYDNIAVNLSQHLSATNSEIVNFVGGGTAYIDKDGNGHFCYGSSENPGVLTALANGGGPIFKMPAGVDMNTFAAQLVANNVARELDNNDPQVEGVRTVVTKMNDHKIYIHFHENPREISRNFAEANINAFGTYVVDLDRDYTSARQVDRHVTYNSLFPTNNGRENAHEGCNFNKNYMCSLVQSTCLMNKVMNTYAERTEPNDKAFVIETAFTKDNDGNFHTNNAHGLQQCIPCFQRTLEVGMIRVELLEQNEKWSDFGRAIKPAIDRSVLNFDDIKIQVVDHSRVERSNINIPNGVRAQLAQLQRDHANLEYVLDIRGYVLGFRSGGQGARYFF